MASAAPKSRMPVAAELSGLHPQRDSGTPQDQNSMHQPITAPEIGPQPQLAVESDRWHRLYEAVLANTPDLGYIFDLNHRFTYANQALLSMWGRTWDEAIGKNCLELGYESWHAEMHDREIDQVITTRQSIRGEVPFNGANGRRIYDYIFFPVFGPSGEIEAVAGSTRDITEQKRTRDLLREQTRILELIATGSSIGECLTALTASVPRLRPGAQAAVLLANPSGTNIDRAFSGDFPLSFDQGIHDAPISELAFGACGTAIFEGRPVICADIPNETHWAKSWRDLCVAHGVLASLSTPILGPAEKHVASFFLCFNEAHEPDEWETRIGLFGAHVAGIAIERIRATQARRENEERLRTDLEDTLRLQTISAAISSEQDSETLYDKVLDSAVALMHSDFGTLQMFYPERGARGELRLLASRGLTPEAAAYWEWVSPETRSTCGIALASGKRVVVPDIAQCSPIEGSEEQSKLLQAGIHAAQSTPLVSRTGKFLGMITTHWRSSHEPSGRDFRLLDIVARQAADLIERKLAEDRQRQSDEALRKSEKFAAAGRMAATVAHEINNPLEAVTNLAYLLAQEDLSPSARDFLRLLQVELDRVSHITRQTLAFYREGKSAHDFDLTGPIHAAVALFTRKAEQQGATIETITNTPAPVCGFPGELRQVFANLISNALEAGSSTIKIRISPSRRLNGDQPRPGVCVLVADNGSGIPPETARRLFQPFFTTKEEKGTGLGLWVSKGIMQKHEGSIRARTSTQRDRRGTAFRLFLPILDPERTDALSANQTRQSSGEIASKNVSPSYPRLPFPQ